MEANTHFKIPLVQGVADVSRASGIVWIRGPNKEQLEYPLYPDDVVKLVTALTELGYLDAEGKTTGKIWNQ